MSTCQNICGVGT